MSGDDVEPEPLMSVLLRRTISLASLTASGKSGGAIILTPFFFSAQILEVIAGSAEQRRVMLSERRPAAETRLVLNPVQNVVLVEGLAHTSFGLTLSL
jgi:hypothetical protein